MRSPRYDRIGNFHEVIDNLSTLFNDLDARAKRNSDKASDHSGKPSDEYLVRATKQLVADD